MFDWVGILTFVAMVIVFVLAVRLLMDNRSPATTLAWLMVLTFIPILGVVIYFFFGENTRKKRIMSRRSLDQLSKNSMLSFVEQKNLSVPNDWKPLSRLFFNQSGALPFSNNEAQVFIDGYGFFTALLQAIGRAKSHIHLTTYIFEDDALGALLADALIDRAKQGIEVRVVYDAVGNWKVSADFYERMRDGGVEILPFMPVRFPAFTRKINYRNHRKICVVDGEVGFIGGMNIALRYVKGSDGREWRDTHLMIKGGGVYGLQSAFLVDWYFVDGTLISNRRYYPPVAPTINNACVTQIVTSSPLSPYPEMMQGYQRILLEAKDYVYMETPYFLPTEPILTAMQTCVQSGVDVRLMIPLHPDSRMVEWAGRSYVAEAHEAGVKVYFYKKGFNHSKLLIVDDIVSTCGSTNVDFRSFENNFEANAFFYDQDLAVRLRHVFEQDMEDSVEYDDVKGPRTLMRRVGESAARLLAPLL